MHSALLLELSRSKSVYWYIMHLLESSANLLHEVCKDVDINILSHLLEDEPVTHAQLGTTDGNMLLLNRDISCTDWMKLLFYLSILKSLPPKDEFSCSP